MGTVKAETGGGLHGDAELRRACRTHREAERPDRDSGRGEGLCEGLEDGQKPAERRDENDLGGAAMSIKTPFPQRKNDRTPNDQPA